MGKRKKKYNLLSMTTLSPMPYWKLNKIHQNKKFKIGPQNNG